MLQAMGEFPPIQNTSTIHPRTGDPTEDDSLLSQ